MAGIRCFMRHAPHANVQLLREVLRKDALIQADETNLPARPRSLWARERPLGCYKLAGRKAARPVSVASQCHTLRARRTVQLRRWCGRFLAELLGRRTQRRAAQATASMRPVAAASSVALAARATPARHGLEILTVMAS